VAEFALNRVENWAFYAPQTEEEAGESQEAISFEIANSKNITLANWHAYRVHPQSQAGGYRYTPLQFLGQSVSAMRMSTRESGLGTCDTNGCGTYLRASKFPAENSIRDLTHHLRCA